MPDLKQRRFPRWFLGTVVLEIILVLGCGAWFYDNQEQRMVRQSENELLAIVQMKSAQISHWRKDLITDVKIVTQIPFFLNGAARAIERPESEMGKKMLHHFRTFQKYRRYPNIQLLDARGIPRLSLRPDVSSVPGIRSKAVAEALRERKSVITDLLDTKTGEQPYLSVITPLFPGGEERHPPFGTLVFDVGVENFLYPALRTWPTPSSSAETILVRREGQEVLFLSQLRHQPKAAIKYRAPLDRKEMPAVMAVLGYEGIAHGKDYHGIAVIAAIKAIPDSPWFLIAKMDEAQVLADWRLHAGLIIAVIVVLLAAIVAMTYVFWLRSEKDHYRTHLQDMAARIEGEERYRTTLMSIGDGVIVTCWRR